MKDLTVKENTYKIELSGNNIIDLSHTAEADMPCDPALALPELDFFSREGSGLQLHNLEVIRYCPHTGTHMDSPFHVCSEWGSMETVDPAVLIGPATVLSLTVPEYDYAVTREDIEQWEAEFGEIPKGDAVLLHTGHADKWEQGSGSYIDKGYIRLAPSAAAYLAEKKTRFIALESISVDGADTEVHKLLLGNGVCIVENVCNLEKIGQIHCSTIGTFPAVKGASGAWVRLLALV